MWAWWWAVVAWACMVGCSGWSTDGINHNFATPRRRFPDWTFTSPKNVRAHLHIMWEDRSPSHPRLRFAAIRTPMAAAAPPQLRDNSLLLGETCHARHLHTCGGRVIEEFSHEPDYSDACRIREEFLDCMEKEQKEPCRLQGSYFTQTGTRRIIGRIKKLLWSARGCILGHSP